MTKQQPPAAQSRFDANFRRGTTLLHQGKAAEALPLLEKAHELEPDHSDAAINLSGAYILTKKFRKAIPILEALSEWQFENVTVWTNLGAAYLGNPVLARDDEQLRAINAFTRAYEINPAAPNAAYNIGLVYRDRRENEEAVVWFQRALQANPKDKDARNFIRKLSENL